MDRRIVTRRRGGAESMAAAPQAGRVPPLARAAEMACELCDVLDTLTDDELKIALGVLRRRLEASMQAAAARRAAANVVPGAGESAREEGGGE